MNLEKRNSYASKSILSLLQTIDIPLKAISLTPDHYIPSSIFLIFILISLWAIGFYSILGLCYYVHSGILIEDLHLHYTTNEQVFSEEIARQYSQLTFHCLFSLMIYVILFIICSFILKSREKKWRTLPRSNMMKP